MAEDKAILVRQLIPTSYHFDGYNIVGCRNARDKPFFSEGTIPLGDYALTVRRISFNCVLLEFQSVCKIGKLSFKPYQLTIEEFVSKLKMAVKTGSDYIYFEIIPVFNETQTSFCTRCNAKTGDCIRMVKDRPKSVMAAVSFDVDDIRKALASYYEIVNPQTTKLTGGISTMKKNNFMGVNFEFGPSKDNNIAATLLGIAVRDGYGGSWFTYDPVNQVHKNLANVKMGSFPVYLLPVAKPQAGDLIKRNGSYLWIKSVTDEGTFKAIGAVDGQVHEILPTESLIPGFNLYTKVVALDMKSLTDPKGNSAANNVLAAMLMMQWSKNDGKTEFSLDDISEDSFNGMGAMLPLVLAQSSGGSIGNIFGTEGGQINLPMLMMLGGTDSDESGFMQMYVLSQLLSGGGNTGFEGIIPGLSGGNQKTPRDMLFDSKSGKDEVVCGTCGNTYPSGTNFCPKCGGKTRPIRTASYCHKCGAELMNGAAFCHKCGTKVGPAVCPSCNKEVPEGAAFCPTCGKNLNEVPAPATETESENLSKETADS